MPIDLFVLRVGNASRRSLTVVARFGAQATRRSRCFHACVVTVVPLWSNFEPISNAHHNGTTSTTSGDAILRISMKRKSDSLWVNDMRGAPKIEGSLEISKSRDGIFIAGDPQALRTLADLVFWLANVDQESKRSLPDGERCHVHLYPKDVADGFGDSLTRFSENTEICRLDAKGTSEFPARYARANRKPPTKPRTRSRPKKNNT
jgi:hypothetical protein